MTKLQEFFSLFFKNLAGKPEAGGLVVSNRPDLGEYQCNGALAVAKPLKKSPKEIAELLVSEVPDDLLKDYSFSIAGPGFINVKIKDHLLLKMVNSNLSVKKESKKVIIDYGSPNVAKGMHVGHLRSTLIGSALVSIHKFAGHTVVGDNHLGDWGTPIGIVLSKISKENNFSWALEDIEKLYVDGSIEYKDKANIEFKKEVTETTKKLQSNDPDLKSMWSRLVNVTISSLKEDYAKLGISFDLWEGESFFESIIPPMIEELKEKGFCTVSEGALVIELDKLPAVLLEKSDGGYLYHTTDMACVKHRQNKYDEILYVVDNRQKIHFEQIFAAAKKVGYLDKEVAKHIAFGTINGADGKPFKTRSGGVLKLKDLIDQVYAAAKEKMSEEVSSPSYSSNLETIAIGSLKFAELKHNRLSDYIFDINEFMALEGFTGPYVMYSCVRANSILNKAEGSVLAPLDVISSDSERNLVAALNLFSNAFEKALKLNEPHHLCEYGFDLANKFNSFYGNTHILSESDLAKKNHYLWLTKKVAETLSATLNILGINVPTKM